MQVTVRYGMQSVTLERPEGTTVGTLVTDPNTKAVLGFGENVVPVVEGATVEHSFPLSESDEVTLQPRAATKGN